MFRHRILVTVSAALWMLAGFVADAGAITVNVTALPASASSLCAPGTTNAVPNDGNSDQTAFDCAVALIGSSSPAMGAEARGTIYVPAGEFKMTATLFIFNWHVALRGEGQQISKMVWNHGGDGIYFTVDARQVELHVHGAVDQPAHERERRLGDSRHLASSRANTGATASSRP